MEGQKCVGQRHNKANRDKSKSHYAAQNLRAGAGLGGGTALMPCSTGLQCIY